MEPTTFASTEAFHEWLRVHEDDATEIWVVAAKKGASIPAISYQDALLVALSHGWIDGLARRLDDQAFLQRFTPRRPKSPWSARNVARAEAMLAAGELSPRGLAEVERAKLDGRWEASASA